MDPEQLPLRDLHLPEALGWWPPAPGWWVLALFVAALLGRYLWRLWRDWRRGSARRLALRELSRIAGRYAADGNAARLASDLSALLRRAMLAYAPRGHVAGLTGEAWLAWLDRGLEQPLFAEGPGRAIVSLPYRRDATAREPEVDELLAAVRQRLGTPLPEERY